LGSGASVANQILLRIGLVICQPKSPWRTEQPRLVLEKQKAHQLELEGLLNSMERCRAQSHSFALV
jgi:hypothetical protein